MSKIEVNAIEPQCGTTLTVGAAGTTVTVPSNVVKSNALQASDAGNIISQSGTTITLGATGDSINLASGATQSGFGRTGTVDWQTGSIKTSTFTAANGEGYFANTSGGAFTMNLPAGVVGNIVSVVDYTNTFQTNNLTIAPNGTEKIGGIAASNTLSTEGQSVTFVYVDATEGWKNVQDSTSNVTGNPFMVATVSGACNTLATAPCCANTKIATFTGPGSFTVSNASATAPENIVSYMVVAGGGGVGCSGGGGGGGGAGGFREVKSPTTPYTASPLDGYATPANLVTVTAQTYPIQVGGGGPGTGAGGGGTPSVFSTITSTGGGKGGREAAKAGGPGGSGGGGGYSPAPAGLGNTPPVSPPQGNNGGGDGGGGPGYGGAGAGGASASGTSGSPSAGGNGGNGVATSINGSSITRAGGGGGGSRGSSGSGGSGGGGAGSGGAGVGNAGTVNTGGGAGGGTDDIGGTGGSGIVIIRYKFQ